MFCLCSQDAKFVEERRKQLQSYLRSVMNKVIQMVPEFAASPKKETLVQLVPFFVWVLSCGHVLGDLQALLFRSLGLRESGFLWYHRHCGSGVPRVNCARIETQCLCLAAPKVWKWASLVWGSQVSSVLHGFMFLWILIKYSFSLKLPGVPKWKWTISVPQA